MKGPDRVDRGAMFDPDDTDRVSPTEPHEKFDRHFERQKTLEKNPKAELASNKAKMLDEAQNRPMEYVDEKNPAASTDFSTIGDGW